MAQNSVSQTRHGPVSADCQGPKLLEESLAQALTLSLHELFHQALDLRAIYHPVQ
jgi:hypothetical protein